MSVMDWERFGYLTASKRDELGLSQRDLVRLSNCSLRQVNSALRGRPVDAACFKLLCLALQLDEEMFFRPDDMARVEKIREFYKEQEKQTVTPDVSHETWPKIMEAAE